MKKLLVASLLVLSAPTVNAFDDTTICRVNAFMVQMIAERRDSGMPIDDNTDMAVTYLNNFYGKPQTTQITQAVYNITKRVYEQGISPYDAKMQYYDHCRQVASKRNKQAGK